MNKYQVVLSNNDVLQINADGVDRDGGYLFFFEFQRDEGGNPKPHANGEGFECVKVAEFLAWNGWKCAGPYIPAEAQPKAEVKETTAADLAESLRQAIMQGQAGKAPEEPRVSYNPPPAQYDPYKGRS